MSSLGLYKNPPSKRPLRFTGFVALPHVVGLNGWYGIGAAQPFAKVCICATTGAEGMEFRLRRLLAQGARAARLEGDKLCHGPRLTDDRWQILPDFVKRKTTTFEEMQRFIKRQADNS